MSLILASGSPRRKELLAMAAPDYLVKVSDVDESGISADSPRQLAQALARAKCLAVAALAPCDTVLGCDTVVELDGQVFGKPRDPDDARRMLQALSGKRHLVHTGVCIARGDRVENFAVTSAVDFFDIDPEDLERYIATDEPYDKAGGYAIQGHAAVWCRGIEGCYYNIMGLPVSRVARALKQFDL